MYFLLFVLQASSLLSYSSEDPDKLCILDRELKHIYNFHFSVMFYSFKLRPC